MILPQEVIRKKRQGLALSNGELQAFFGGFLKGEVADYQMGAMLMAITLKGMTDKETADLTRLMRDPLIALNPGSNQLLLGWSYADLGFARLGTPSYFLLERERPLGHIAYPKHPQGPSASTH